MATSGSVWSRAWKDTEQFRQSAWSFWGLEVVGAALFSFIGVLLTPRTPTLLETAGYPTLGIITGFLVVFTCIYLWHLFRAPYRQRDEAKQYIDRLEQKPTVEFGNDAIEETDGYFIPVTNHGPGDAEIYCQVNRVRYVEVIPQSKSPANCYVRWQGGNGNWPEGRPSYNNFKEEETKRLHVMQFTGFATLPNEQEGREGKILGANVSGNVPIHASIGTTIEIEIQAFGTPNLARTTSCRISIPVPGRRN